MLKKKTCFQRLQFTISKATPINIFMGQMWMNVKLALIARSPQWITPMSSVPLIYTELVFFSSLFWFSSTLFQAAADSSSQLTSSDQLAACYLPKTKTSNFKISHLFAWGQKSIRRVQRVLKAEHRETFESVLSRSVQRKTTSDEGVGMGYPLLLATVITAQLVEKCYLSVSRKRDAVWEIIPLYMRRNTVFAIVGSWI